MSLTELETRIAPSIERAVRRAHTLWQEAATTSVGGLVVSGAADNTPIKVLIAGNSCNLGVVRRMIAQAFEIPESEIGRNPGGLKASVAQGAAEEHALLRDFGSSGLISYRATGLTDRIPWAIGLYHPTLEGVGFKDGFCPVFERGTPHGAEMTVVEGSNPLVHKELKDLGIYSHYRDGSPPAFMGFVDLKRPLSGRHRDVDVPPVQPAGVTVGETFGLRITLQADRTVKVHDLQTGREYPFNPAAEHWKPEKNPFSGVH